MRCAATTILVVVAANQQGGCSVGPQKLAPNSVTWALRALERVPRFLAGRSLQAYLADDLRQSAVERQLEVAGDALGQVRKLDLDLFARVPEGLLIVAFRNVLAHGYATTRRRAG
ncbi:MAG TPA: HepT-like ribonuclease domain-containing protein [Steroidobacteraceae bacterium]|nr:HepT-like ribonuclease domain-containing protein [Steroidobacteraceae bacterium]